MSLFDENAAILRDIVADGSDLGPARTVDFSHLLPSREAAELFARMAEREGFSTNVQGPEGDDERWDVTASREMVPSCEELTETEWALGVLAQSLGGQADGWGFSRV